MKVQKIKFLGLKYNVCETCLYSLAQAAVYNFHTIDTKTSSNSEHKSAAFQTGFPCVMAR
jgi:hypothetical protein